MATAPAAAAQAHLAAVQRAVRTEDGAALAALLALRCAPELDAALGALPAAQLGALVGGVFADGSPLGLVLTAHFGALHSLGGAVDAGGGSAGAPLRALEAAFDAEHDALKHFISLVSESGNNWVVRPLHALINGAYALGQRLEKALDAHGQRDAARGRIVSVGRVPCALAWLDARATALRRALSPAARRAGSPRAPPHLSPPRAPAEHACNDAAQRVQRDHQPPPAQGPAVGQQAMGLSAGGAWCSRCARKVAHPVALDCRLTHHAPPPRRSTCCSACTSR